MVLPAQQHPLRVCIFEQRFAEGVKRIERHCFSPFSRAFHHARLHFARGFFRERQPQDVFPGQVRIRIEQLPDALGNHACLPRARARNHQQWPFAVRDRAPLRIVQLQPALFQRLHLEQSLHESTRVAEFQAWRK